LEECQAYRYLYLKGNIRFIEIIRSIAYDAGILQGFMGFEKGNSLGFWQSYFPFQLIQHFVMQDLMCYGISG